MVNLVVVFTQSRCGSSSLEIALQNIGYETVNVDSGRAILDNKKKAFRLKKQEDYMELIDTTKNVKNITKKFINDLLM